MSYLVTILLPGSGHLPIGGFRVVYEYANGLVARGHDVTVVHPAMLYRDSSITEVPKKMIRYLQRRVDGSYRPNCWFNMDPRVRMEWVPSLHPRYIPEGDVAIATAWQSAEWLDTYPPERGEKVCLVYDFEHYMNASPGVRKRMALVFTQRMKAIATSPAVSDMLTACGAKDIAYIPNGINFQVFHQEKNLSDPLR